MQNANRLLIVAIPLLLATMSFAQFGGKAGFGEAFRPDVLPRDMVLVVETLKLEEWQRPIVESLIDDYTANFKTGCDTVRQKMVDMAKSQKGDSKSIKGLLAPIQAWVPEKDRMFADFMASVKGQLSDTQRERWPQFERTMRREKSLEDSDLSGEGVDLIAISRQMQLPPEALTAAQTTLDEYELQLDLALVARDQRIDALMPDFTQAMESMDFDRGVELQNQIMKARVAVRVVQDEFIEKIAESLATPLGPDFRTRALAAGYKEAFQPDPLANFFQVVTNLPDLTPEQRTGVDGASAKWQEHLENLRARMLHTMRQDEPSKPARATKAAQARAAAKEGRKVEQPGIEAMVPLRNEKNRLVQETRDSVLALLTAEQREAIVAGVPGLKPPPPSSPKAPMYQGAGQGGKDATSANKPTDPEGKPVKKEVVE